MHSCPGKLPLKNGDSKAQVAEDAHTRAHCCPQQADWKQANDSEETQQPSEGHLACPGHRQLQTVEVVAAGGLTVQ